MRRTEVDIVVFDPATGIAVQSAVVQIRERGTGNLATVYQAEAGSTTIANPLTTDVYGRVPGWVDRGDYYAEISGTGLADYVLYFDSAPGADGAIDNDWHEPASISADKLLLQPQTSHADQILLWTGTPTTVNVTLDTPPELEDGLWLIVTNFNISFSNLTTDNAQLKMKMLLEGVDLGNDYAQVFKAGVSGSKMQWPLSGSFLLPVSGGTPTKTLGFAIETLVSGQQLTLQGTYSTVTAMRVS